MFRNRVITVFFKGFGDFLKQRCKGSEAYGYFGKREMIKRIGLKAAWKKLPIFKQVMNMSPNVVKKAPCQKHIIEGDEVDLGKLPIQTCWAGGAEPLIFW